MKNYIFYILLLVTLVSCDEEVGTDGVVINSVTGDRIENVEVYMKSQEQGDMHSVSDSLGYFNVFKSFSCGISSCNTNYKISFIKEGYLNKEISENYASSADAGYINGKYDDTLVVKLEPLKIE